MKSFDRSQSRARVVRPHAVGREDVVKIFTASGSESSNCAGARRIGAMRRGPHLGLDDDGRSGVDLGGAPRAPQPTITTHEASGSTRSTFPHASRESLGRRAVNARPTTRRLRDTTRRSSRIALPKMTTSLPTSGGPPTNTRALSRGDTIRDTNHDSPARDDHDAHDRDAPRLGTKVLPEHHHETGKSTDGGELPRLYAEIERDERGGDRRPLRPTSLGALAKPKPCTSPKGERDPPAPLRVRLPCDAARGRHPVLEPDVRDGRAIAGSTTRDDGVQMPGPRSPRDRVRDRERG